VTDPQRHPCPDCQRAGHLAARRIVRLAGLYVAAVCPCCDRVPRPDWARQHELYLRAVT